MDKKLRIVLSKLFDDYCFILTEKGNIMPTYFLVKDKEIIKVVNKGVDQKFYMSFVLHQATQKDAEALVLISENNVVTGDRRDDDIKAITKGNLKISEHPNNEEYLILMYVSKDGEREGLFGKIEKDPTGVKFIRNHEWASDSVYHTM